MKLGLAIDTSYFKELGKAWQSMNEAAMAKFNNVGALETHAADRGCLAKAVRAVEDRAGHPIVQSVYRRFLRRRREKSNTDLP